VKNSPLDVFAPAESNVIAAVALGAYLVYSAFSGTISLMPYTVERKINPRAYYVIYLIILAVFASTLYKLFV
jgi:hypothetical protein